MDIHDKMNLILHWNLMKTSPNVVDNIMCIFEDYKDGFEATIHPTHVTMRYYYYGLPKRLLNRAKRPVFKDIMNRYDIKYIITCKGNHDFD